MSSGFRPPAATFVKGVGLNSAMEWAERELGHDAMAERLSALADEFGDYRRHRLASSLVPLPAAAAAWGAANELHGGTRAERRVFFQRMGVYIADSNLNGIYKAMMSLLVNPERLAKRIPVLWNSYFRGLDISLDLADLAQGVARTSVTGFGGAPHIGEMAEGWVAYAFELVGGKDVRAYEQALEAGALTPDEAMTFTIQWRLG